MAILELVIDRRQELDNNIVVLDLRDADGAMLPAFEAGAHVDVHLPGGLVRQYSLCGAPADRDRYRLGILLDPASRGGSASIHRDFQAGQPARIGLPRNLFPLAAEASHSVMIGGGIGITPLLAMAHQLRADGGSFELHYVARNRGRAGFLPVIDEAGLSDKLQLHLSEGGGFSCAAILPPVSPHTHVYTCGPSGFMDRVFEDARRLGYADHQLHREHFAAAPDTDGDAFEVVLGQSGRVVPVPAGTSIVAALAGIGVRIDVSCEQGVCGTCLCTVLDGIPDHRDVYLTDDEKQDNDQILLCCSRARTPRLVLDL